MYASSNSLSTPARALALAAAAGLTTALLLAPGAAHARYPRVEAGARVVGLGLTAREQQTQDYGGAGALLRYRHSRRFAIELGADVTHGEMEDETARDLVHLNSALLFYFFPGGLIEMYGLAGMGSMMVRWHDLDDEVDYGAGSGMTFQAGIGVQLLLDRFRIFADLRGLAVAPLHDGGGEGSAPETPYLRNPGGEYRLIEDPEPLAHDGVFGSSFQVGVAYSW